MEGQTDFSAIDDAFSKAMDTAVNELADIMKRAEAIKAENQSKQKEIQAIWIKFAGRYIDAGMTFAFVETHMETTFDQAAARSKVQSGVAA